MIKKSMLLLAVVAVGACQKSDSKPAEDVTVTGDVMVDSGAMVPMDPAAVVRDANNRELGELVISETAEGLRVTGRLVGLPPGDRALHLHTVGQCEAPFTTAGPHWNPTNKQHGRDNPAGSHHGDLLNVTIAADSSVTIDQVTMGGTLRGEGGLLDADGASVVIHGGKDDYKTDPAGNAGDRIACGVVVAR